MTTKVQGSNGVEFPDGTTQGSAAYSKAESDGPAFMASSSGGIFTYGTTIAKVTNLTEQFDTNSCFDQALSRFTPNVAGYYSIAASLNFGSQASAAERAILLYKNGAIEASFGDLALAAGNTTFIMNGAALVYLNGTTDYVELYLYSNLAGTVPADSLTRFQGFLARRA